VGELSVKRGRPKRVDRAFLEANFDMLNAAIEAGALEVRTPAGAVVDLKSLRVSIAAPPPAEVNPNFPLDDANNDVNPVRPATASPNAGIEPSVHARGELPDLLKPTLEETSEAAEENASVSDSLEEGTRDSAEAAAVEEESAEAPASAEAAAAAAAAAPTPSPLAPPAPVARPPTGKGGKGKSR